MGVHPDPAAKQETRTKPSLYLPSNGEFRIGIFKVSADRAETQYFKAYNRRCDVAII
jgi:hypothetical protein